MPTKEPTDVTERQLDDAISQREAVAQVLSAAWQAVWTALLNAASYRKSRMARCFLSRGPLIQIRAVTQTGVFKLRAWQRGPPKAMERLRRAHALSLPSNSRGFDSCAQGGPCGTPRHPPLKTKTKTKKEEIGMRGPPFFLRQCHRTPIQLPMRTCSLRQLALPFPCLCLQAEMQRLRHRLSLKDFLDG